MKLRSLGVALLALSGSPFIPTVYAQEAGVPSATVYCDASPGKSLLYTAGAVASSPIAVSLRAVSSELSSAVLALGAEWGGDAATTAFCAGENFYYGVAPDVRFYGSTDGVFGGSSAQVNLFYSWFKTVPIIDPETGEQLFVDGKGAVQPSFDSLFHSLEFSGGVGFGSNLHSVSALGEFGYVPYYDGLFGTFLGLNPEIGAFVQAGYTFDTGLATAEFPMREAELIEETPGALLRFKLSGSGKIVLLSPPPDTEGLQISVLPSGWLWYDVLDSRIYGLLEGKVELGLSETATYDVNFKLGSPPGNMSSAATFGTGLAIRF